MAPMSHEELLAELANIVDQLGWEIATDPAYDEDEPLDGIIVGTEEFIERMLDSSPGGAKLVYFDGDIL